MSNAAGPGRCVVMVVEDDPDNLDSIVELLQDEGYEVLAARSGEEATEQLTRVRPQVLISDYLLPDMTGAELVTRLQRGAGPPIPVVFLTGMQRPAQVGDALVLNKPVVLDDLLGALRQYSAAAPCGANAAAPG